MIRKINLYEKILLLIMSVPSLPAFADMDNPYGLIREAEFEQRFVNDIEPYWKKNGTKGNFRADDGINISYMAFEVENEKGAIVISSGRTESYIKYQELVYELTRQGYSVYLHDHRGQGYSDRLLKDDLHKGHVDEFNDYVNDLDTFVRKVVLLKSHKKMFLLAHSMGGGIATRYIELYPNVFNAAALSSPMHAPDARIFVSPEGGCMWFRLMDWVCDDCYAVFTTKRYSPKPFNENEYTHSKIRYDHFLKTYAENETVQLGGPTRGWAGQVCAASEKIINDAGSITIPVLVLQAGDDTAVTPEGQNEFCDNLKKETGKACFGGGPVPFERAKHELFIESDDYRIPAISRILDFYSRVE